MAFDKTKPVADTEADADLVRGNFNALAVHHKGDTAPAAPELGWIWWDDSNPANEKLKCYGGAIAAWRDMFDHMESTPVPSSGGGGGGGTSRLVVSGSFDMAQGAPDAIFDIVAPKVRSIVRGYLWPMPQGGGAWPAKFNYTASNYGLLSTGEEVGWEGFTMDGGRPRVPFTIGDDIWVATLAAPVAQGDTEIDLDGLLVTHGYSIIITDGTNYEFQYALSRVGTVITMRAPIVRAAGWGIGTNVIYVTGELRPQVYMDAEDDAHIHLIAGNPSVACSLHYLFELEVSS
jgi:hypothetical protein